MKYFFMLILVFVFQINADDKIDVNFKDLKISELIIITSKIIDKNILFTHEIEGTVDFIPNKSVSKIELLKILELVLDEKGYSLIDEKNLLRVIKSSEIKKESITIKFKNIKTTEAKKNLDEFAKSIFTENTEKNKISFIENVENNSLVLIGEKKNIEYLSNYIKDIDNKTIVKKKKLKFSL